MQKTVNAAVIDSGIYNKGYMNNKVVAKINFIAGDEYITHDQLAVVHGTTCAEIMSRICPQVRFLDLTAMCPDGTAELSNLLKALDWCIQNKIKLIHLSLGTVNYFDIKPLEEKIRNLTDQNAIIVAAYHNRNIRTFPAAFPGVLGVRQDRKGIVGEYEFLFQEQEGYGYENSIVAHWWGVEAENRANSYAAPVITGYVARVLMEKGEADFSYVLEALREIAVSDKKYPDDVKNVIQTSRDISIPVIAGMELCHGELQGLAEMFESKGYYAVLLGENEGHTTAIPLDYYGGKDTLLRQILHTVDIVYRPDIIFLDLQSSEIYDASKEADIDICISYNCDMYVQSEPCNSGLVTEPLANSKILYNIKTEGMSEITRKPEEIFDIICRYFA